jgi:hypothetical protein
MTEHGYSQISQGCVQPLAPIRTVLSSFAPLFSMPRSLTLNRDMTMQASGYVILFLELKKRLSVSQRKMALEEP